MLPAKGDAGLLKVVWTNLISNAVKYSSRKKDSQIMIDSYSNGGEHIYSVSDNGIGFDMKDYNKLFSVFKRLNGSNDFPGTGIGLASVKRVIEKHEGRVWAESFPGEGATFYFTLPYQ
jgi:light-regulated signal transduction histidine kinase (bacteriophytochrome)